MVNVSRSDLVGALINERLGEVITALDTKSFALNHFQVYPMKSRTLEVPVVTELAEMAAVKSEDLTSPNSKKSTTKTKIEKVDLVAEDIASIVIIPEAVADDAEISWESFILPQLVNDFARKLDLWTLFPVTGRPAAWGKAVFEVASDAGALVPATADFAEDANQALALVEGSGFDPTAIAASRAIRATLRGLRNDNGTPIYETSIANGGTQSTLYGFPIDYTSGWDRSDALAIAGDFKKAILGIRQDVTTKVLTEATVGGINLAEQDAVALRVNLRVAFGTVNPASYADEGITAAPFAAVTPAPVTP